MRKVTVINPNSTVNILEKRKIRTAAYARVSTDSAEQLISLEAQVKHYTDYIRSNPSWEFAGVYADEGISGTKKENRTELLRLISDCEARKIDFIIVKSISRFARNTTDCLEIVRHLTELGIGIYFEKENINTLTSDSELMLSILSSLAADESVSISQNNKWGIKKRFQNGTYKLSCPPYGYDYDGETLVPNKEQAKIVRRIFSETLAGLGSRAIAIGLNKEGIKSPQAKKWSSDVIRGILENEKYIGDVLFQKTYTDDNFRRNKNNGEEDKYYIKDHHKAIISREDFEAAARIIVQRGKEKGNIGESEKYQNRYVFSGQIICGECGGTFKRRIHQSGKAGQYIAFACKTHVDTNGISCSMKFIREEQIKRAFITMMNKLYSNRNQILKPFIEGLKQIDSGGRYEEIAEIEKNIKEITEQQQVLVGLLTKGYLEPPIYNERNNHLQTELEALKKRRDILQNDVLGAKTTASEAEELYKYMCKEGSIIEEFSDDLFLRFVNEVIVFSPTEIGFKLKSGLCLKERMVS